MIQVSVSRLRFDVEQFVKFLCVRKKHKNMKFCVIHKLTLVGLAVIVCSVTSIDFEDTITFTAFRE